MRRTRVISNGGSFDSEQPPPDGSVAGKIILTVLETGSSLARPSGDVSALPNAYGDLPQPCTSFDDVDGRPREGSESSKTSRKRPFSPSPVFFEADGPVETSREGEIISISESELTQPSFQMTNSRVQRTNTESPPSEEDFESEYGSDTGSRARKSRSKKKQARQAPVASESVSQPRASTRRSRTTPHTAVATGSSIRAGPVEESVNNDDSNAAVVAPESTGPRDSVHAQDLSLVPVCMPAEQGSEVSVSERELRTIFTTMPTYSNITRFVKCSPAELTQHTRAMLVTMYKDDFLNISTHTWYNHALRELSYRREPRAMYYRGWLMRRCNWEKKQRQGLLWILAAKNVGDILAQYECLYHGWNQPQDRSAAVRLLLPHCDSDSDPRIRYLVGIHYQKGEGVTQERKKALHYLQLAHSEGDILASHDLGVWKLELAEEEQSEETAKSLRMEAFKLIEASALRKYPDAQCKLGELLATGCGAERDLAAAHYWWEVASRQAEFWEKCAALMQAYPINGKRSVQKQERPVRAVETAVVNDLPLFEDIDEYGPSQMD